MVKRGSCFAQGVNDGAEDEVFGLLLFGERRKRDQAWMFLVLGVLVGTVGPALVQLLAHPTDVARLGAEVTHAVQVYTHAGASALPLRSVFPCWLAHVAQRFAVGFIHLVAYTGDPVEWVAHAAPPSLSFCFRA